MEVAAYGILGRWDRRQVSRDQFVKRFRIPSIIRIEGLTRLNNSLAVCVGYVPLDECVGKCDSQDQYWDHSTKKCNAPLGPSKIVLDDCYEKPDWTHNNGEHESPADQVPKQYETCTKQTPEVVDEKQTVFRNSGDHAVSLTSPSGRPNTRAAKKRLRKNATGDVCNGDMAKK